MSKSSSELRGCDYILSEQVICLFNNKNVSDLKFVYYYV